MSEETTNQEGIVLTPEEHFLKEQLRMMREARLREQIEITESLKTKEQE